MKQPWPVDSEQHPHHPWPHRSREPGLREADPETLEVAAGSGQPVQTVYVPGLSFQNIYFTYSPRVSTELKDFSIQKFGCKTTNDNDHL